MRTTKIRFLFSCAVLNVWRHGQRCRCQQNNNNKRHKFEEKETQEMFERKTPLKQRHISLLVHTPSALRYIKTFQNHIKIEKKKMCFSYSICWICHATERVFSLPFSSQFSPFVLHCIALMLFFVIFFSQIATTIIAYIVHTVYV